MADELRVQFSRFSAFYTPLIATLAGSFLKDEGFAPKHSVSPPGRSAIEGLVAGTVHVCQSAPSQGFGPLENVGSAARAVRKKPSTSRGSMRWTASFRRLAPLIRRS